MFTGIVEDTGTIRALVSTDGGRRLTIDAPAIVENLGLGDSVSVQGACLTAVAVSSDRFAVELVAETLRRTVLGDLAEGDTVNLERAMRAGGRFDGHIVQGHVDGVGVVRRVEVEGESRRVTIDVPDDLSRYIVEKGSITVDGVSLTVAGVAPSAFEIALIPHTLDVTTLGRLEAGARVNIEVDILAKYVDRLLEARS